MQRISKRLSISAAAAIASTVLLLTFACSLGTEATRNPLTYSGSAVIQANNFAVQNNVTNTTTGQNDARSVNEVDDMNKQFDKIKMILTYFSVAVLTIVLAFIVVLLYDLYKKLRKIKIDKSTQDGDY